MLSFLFFLLLLAACLLFICAALCRIAVSLYTRYKDITSPEFAAFSAQLSKAEKINYISGFLKKCIAINFFILIGSLLFNPPLYILLLLTALLIVLLYYNSRLQQQK